MKPYYEESGIVIYNADCREVLPGISPFTVSLLVADPPYGINAVVRGKTFGTSNACNTNTYIPVYGDDGPFNPSHLLGYRRVILWGGNHYADKLTAQSCWLVWDKRGGLGSNPLADCEIAWTNLGGPARLFTHRWMGMIRDSEQERRLHPTQKPVALMRWCILQCAGADSVLDPYAGSGPTLVAAKQLGRRAIGIEIEERYCEIAAERLRQSVLDFSTPAPEPEQQSLLDGSAA